MPEPTLSRRQLLAAAGLGTAALLGGCAITAIPTTNTAFTPVPNPSPASAGPYLTGRVILGEDAGTEALEQPILRSILNKILYFECINGEAPQTPPPDRVKAAVYFPLYRRTGGVNDYRVPTPNPLGLTKGPYPVLLYAHGFRPTTGVNPCAVASPIHRDFTTIDFMLGHVASYGFVCVAPNLSWAPGAKGDRTLDYAEDGAFGIRSRVLVAYWLYLASRLNVTLFAQQLDLSRVLFVGHSTGAGAATQAGRELSKLVSFKKIAYGLVAPIARTTDVDVRNLVVLGGTLDTLQGANPQDAYTTAARRKTLVTIPGANHFGFTDLCDADNVCLPYKVGDPAGTISRADQQRAGGAYLAALARFYVLGDYTALPYLTGQRAVEGLEALNIQVQADGFLTVPPDKLPPTLSPLNP